MSDEQKKPFPKYVIGIFIISLSLVISVILFVGDSGDPRSFSGIEPKTKIIPIYCNDGICEIACVGFNDVTIVYPMEECE